MILVIDTDNVLYLFNSVNECQDYIEVIDIENNEYEFIDEEGNIYFPKAQKPKFLTKGDSLVLELSGQSDSDKLKSFLNRAREINGKRCGFSTIAELKNYLKI